MDTQRSRRWRRELVLKVALAVLKLVEHRIATEEGRPIPLLTNFLIDKARRAAR